MFDIHGPLIRQDPFNTYTQERIRDSLNNNNHLGHSTGQVLATGKGRTVTPMPGRLPHWIVPVVVRIALEAPDGGAYFGFLGDWASLNALPTGATGSPISAEDFVTFDETGESNTIYCNMNESGLTTHALTAETTIKDFCGYFIDVNDDGLYVVMGWGVQFRPCSLAIA